jgi:hypothetical protein
MVKEIRPNFKLLEKMNDDIIALKNRQATPRTWQCIGNNIIIYFSFIIK